MSTEDPSWVTAALSVNTNAQPALVAKRERMAELKRLQHLREAARDAGLPEDRLLEAEGARAAVVTTLNAIERRKILKKARRKVTAMTSEERRAFLRSRGLDNPEARRRAKLQNDCLNSLAVFTQTFWPVIEPSTKLEWNWHHDVICDALEKVTKGEILRLLINVPPGHMKSVLVNIMWSAWNWFRDPSWRAIHTSYAETLISRDATKTRDIITSSLFQELQPRVYGEGWDRGWQLKNDSTAKLMFATEYHGMRLCTTLTGMGTGHRGHALVVDDPMNAEEHPTPEALQSVISWFDGRMSTRFNKMSEGRIVVIMQRLHENDLAGHIIACDEREKDNPIWQPYEKIIFPAEYNSRKATEKGWDKYDLRTEDGEVLFPAMFDQQVLDNQRIKQGPAGYSAQYDQDPTPAGGGVFDCWKLRFWYPANGPVPPPHLEEDDKGNLVPCEQAPLPDRLTGYAQSWDMNFKTKDDSDFVAGQLWAQSGANAYLITQIYGKFSFARTLEEVRRLTKIEPRAVAKYIEDKANGPAVISMLENEIRGITPIDPQGGKEARMHACSPLVAAGNVWLPHPALVPRVTTGVLGELRAAPRSTKDDQIDAMTQYLNKTMVKRRKYWDALQKRSAMNPIVFARR